VAWETLAIGHGPKTTQIRYKRIQQAKWSVAGEKTVVQIVVIGPLRYKKHQHGPWQYTQPAYLVCTDSHLSVEALIQTYFWRWGIEVNFKEQKQLFGAGQAQLRHPSSVSAAPAVAIASYPALLLAGLRAYGFQARPPSVQPPKWYARKPNAPVSSSDLIHQLQQEFLLWAAANFSPLAFAPSNQTNGQKSVPPLAA